MIFKSVKHWKRTRLIGWLLQIIPYIRLIAVTGSLAQNKNTSRSDIDFFIIGKTNRLWMVRFLCIFLTQILGVRARGKNTAGKICFNRFLSDGYLIINPQNIYHAQEYSSFVVLYDFGLIHTKFISANIWMKKYTRKKASLFLINNQIFKIVRSIKEFFLNGWLGDWFEEKLKHYQLDRIKNNQSYHQKGSRIVNSDDEIFFHNKPR